MCNQFTEEFQVLKARFEHQIILISPVIAFQLRYVPLNDLLAKFHPFLVTLGYYHCLILFGRFSSALL